MCRGAVASFLLPAMFGRASAMAGHSSKEIPKKYSGGFSPGAPPLPIPNREVKPGRADGTAPQCGRVGRRPLS